LRKAVVALLIVIALSLLAAGVADLVDRRNLKLRADSTGSSGAIDLNLNGSE
jgi:hypothetical protein